MFGKTRHFKNHFSEKVNYCNENEIDGIQITMMRFKYYIESVSLQIEKDNKTILTEISSEDPKVSSSMIKQFDVNTKLNYFLDNILKSNIVGIYSYFEHVLAEICEICKDHVKHIKSLKSFKNNNKNGSLINKYNLFLTSEIIPDLSSESLKFDKILVWNQIRNDIVHNNSLINKFDPSKLTHPSILIEYNTFKFLKNDIILLFLSEIDDYLNKVISLINNKYDLIV